MGHLDCLGPGAHSRSALFSMNGGLCGKQQKIGARQFTREREREDRLDAEHEAALRRKACESKNRYSSKAEAEDTIAACAEHGRRGLSAYRCPYCNGWHLTSHPR